jgi:glycosyltransferase involved in cell wall biosynthesis
MVAPTSFFADYGCHVRILEEARVLSRLGQRVTIVTYYTGRDVDALDIRRTLAIPWRSNVEVGSSRHKLAFDVLLGMSTLSVMLRDRPDIVHGHLHEGALIGGVIGKLLRRPVVFDYQGSLSSEMIDHGFLSPTSRMAHLVRRVERFTNCLPDAIITSSSNAAEHLRHAWDVPEARILTLPDCVNTRAFSPELLGPEERMMHRAALGIPADRQVVVYLGLLARHQGTDLLLEAAQQVVRARPDTHFLIMGFPGEQEYYQRAIGMGIDGHVTFTGRVPYDEAPAHLALGDLATAPKLSETEGSGKLLNYMAMGLPTVTFDTPVSREYLREDGVYARRGDPSSLAEQILRLLSDPQASRELGARLRARAEAEYDWDQAAEMLMQVYERLAPRGTEGAGGAK